MSVRMAHSRAPAFLAALAPLVGLSLFAVGASAQGVGPALGTQAPAAALEDLDGKAVQLLTYVPSGKPALIEFWASWCEQCEALQPQLDRIRARHGDKLSMVAVAVAVSQSVRRVKRHLEEHPTGYPFLWDARGEAVRAYNALTTGVVVLLDAQGKVAYTGVGSEQKLEAEVAKLLGG
ncbi:MAG TPA: TlpA disulfide reductase family protein [Longimicrobiales bacterium]|nr:TlpA disulfide reductase family protein [Longimicrobiales bacterium]